MKTILCITLITELTGSQTSQYHPAMNNQIVIKELPPDPRLELSFEQAKHNLRWFNEHANELDVFNLYRGRYVAAIGGERLVADTPKEIYRLVREKHPDGMAVAHVRYIPREKLSRIYAC